MNHHHVVEGAEAGEEEDAAVQFEVEAEADELAHEFTKNGVLPSAGVSQIVYQEGKGGESEQCCSRFSL